MTLGKGSICNRSTKQKLNTKSSMEAEVVGVDGMSLQMLWTNYFMREQGHNVIETMVYQDNKSTMLLENKGNVAKEG